MLAPLTVGSTRAPTLAQLARYFDGRGVNAVVTTVEVARRMAKPARLVHRRILALAKGGLVVRAEAGWRWAGNLPPQEYARRRDRIEHRARGQG